MKKLKIFALAILAMGVCANLTSCNDDDEKSSSRKKEVYKEITLKTAGTLSSFVGADMYEVTSLKISGPLNGDDVSCLRLTFDIGAYDDQRAFSLASLDLSDASIVKGGGAYDNYENFYTSNDEIGSFMFEAARFLEKIILPDGVTSIGVCAFIYCYSLTEITIPSSVTSIGEEAFRNCISLTSITIPDGVTSIGECAFCYCRELTEVYCYATEVPSFEPESYRVFDGISSKAVLYVPATSLDAYVNSDWADYFSSVEEIQ